MLVNWLRKEESGPWLLALDNADDLDMFFKEPRFADFLPRSSNGTIIISTRDERVGRGLSDEVIMIDPLSPEDAELLFRSKILKGDNAGTTPVDSLLEELGFIPLAITQAAAFIKENNISVAEYTEEVVKDDSHLQEYLYEDLPDLRRDAASVNSVVRTWKLSFEHITKQNPQAADLLALIAVLDRQRIPKSLLQQDWERNIDFLKALGVLKAFSLLNVEKDGSTFEVHRLVHLSTQKWLALKGTQKEWQEKALKLIVRTFPSGKHGTWEACDVLFHHALVTLRYLPQAKDMALQRVYLLHNVAEYDSSQGRYNVACLRYKEAFEVRMKLLGSEHPGTLTSLGNLASVLSSQGKYEEAERIYRQTLGLTKKVLGEEHPATLTSMNNLASVLSSQGKYEEAERIHRQTLGLTKMVLGNEHLHTLTSMSNL